MNEENMNPVPQTSMPMQPQESVNQNKNNKVVKGVIVALLILVPLVVAGAIFFNLIPTLGHDAPPLGGDVDLPFGKDTATNNGEFAYDFLRQAYKNGGSDNMIVSPYSMKAAWHTAAAGAQGDTKAEIEQVFGSRTMPKFEQLKSANALFVRDTYAQYLKEDFKQSFEGDLRVTSFDSPDPFNAWVSENTDGMINQIMSDRPKDDMLALIMNAVAMDEKWADVFKCNHTKEDDFTLEDSSTMKVAMMNGAAEKYFETENATGVVREYAKHDDGSAFEFVGIMPKNSVSEYIKGLSSSEIDKMTAGEIVDNSTNNDGSINVVTVSLPRFEYTADLSNGMGILKSLGIKTAFNPDLANFGALMDLDALDKNLYISDVLQRAYIKLNEGGTKAAAVTALPVSKGTSVDDKPKYVYYHVDFNKPFVYLIRDKETKEVVFEGVVQSPDEWIDDTCEESE